MYRQSAVDELLLLASCVCYCRVMQLLGASSAADIASEEFGDGNLNLVFRCRWVYTFIKIFFF